MSDNSLQGLVSFINEIKPYHTKLFEVTEEYIFSDVINVTACDNIENLGITFENEPLCKPVGFGLVFDDTCGFDALMCCDLFDCEPFDITNNDILIDTPILSYSNGDGTITVDGDYRHDTYLQIKNTSGTGVIVLNGDQRSSFDNHSYFIIAPTHTFDIIDMIDNSITISGDATWLLSQRSEIIIEHSAESDGRFVISTIEFDGNDTIVTISNGFEPSTSIYGTLRAFKVVGNRGLYQIDSVDFNGVETLINLNPSTQLKSPNNTPYVPHGSIVLRTGFGIGREVYIDNNGDNDSYFEIYNRTYDYTTDSTTLYLAGCMEYTQMVGAVAQLIGYSPLYDAKSCGIPKSPHVRTAFSESLTIVATVVN